DPGIGAHLLAHLAADHLPNRKPEGASLQVPQRLLEPRQRRHDHRAAAVEADLPDILDVERVRADEPVAIGFEHTLDRLGPALETGFAPAECAVFALDADKQPAGRHQEGFDAGDPALAHASASPACVPLPLISRPAASSSSPGLSVTFLIGTTRHTLDAGSTLRQSAISCL